MSEVKDQNYHNRRALLGITLNKKEGFARYFDDEKEFLEALLLSGDSDNLTMAEEIIKKNISDNFLKNENSKRENLKEDSTEVQS